MADNRFVPPEIATDIIEKNNNKFDVSCEQFLALFTIFVFTLVFRSGRMGRLE